MRPATIRPGETLVYSTRWSDDEADQSDRPAPRGIPLEIVITHDERHEALARRLNLFNFLKAEVRSHAGASL